MKEQRCEQIGKTINVVDGVRADGMHMVKLQHAEQNGNGESRTIYELIETTSTFEPALRAVRVEDEEVTGVFGFGENLSARDMVAARETLEDALRSCTRFYNFGLPK